MKLKTMSNSSSVEVPMPIRTPRLLIKPREIAEGAVICKALLESEMHLKPWMVWAQKRQTVEECEAKCLENIADFNARKDFTLSIYDPSSMTFLGSAGLHHPRWDVPSFMIGYWVHPAFEGKGYITEAVNALTRYCFQVFKANRVYMTCDENNLRSLAVMKRCGFIQEALLKNDTRGATGDLRNTIISARTDLHGLADLECQLGPPLSLR